MTSHAFNAPAVIVTRPQPDADRFALELRNAGLAPVVAPVLEIVPVLPADPPASAEALIFTSANGVRHCGVRNYPGPVFVVGKATQEAARSAGFSNIKGAQSGDAKTLVDFILGSGIAVETSYRHFSGENSSFDVAAALQARGLNASRTIVYRAVRAASLAEEARQALRNTHENLFVAFFSVRTAEAFLDLVEEAKLTNCLLSAHAACLSGAVADTVGRRRWRRMIVAPAPDSDAMLNSIKLGASA